MAKEDKAVFSPEAKKRAGCIMYNMYGGVSSDFSPLGEEEEYRLAMLYKQTGNKEYRDKLVQHNLIFVALIADKYRDSGISIEDLVQEGNVGLIQAAEAYDPEKGYRFTTYCYYWIKRNIFECIYKQSGVMRLSTGMRIIERKYKQYMREHVEGEYVPLQDIADECGCTVKRLQYIIGALNASNNYVSLYTAPSEVEDDGALLDILPDTKTPLVEDIVCQNIVNETVDDLLQTLSDKEARVLIRRYGLHGCEPENLTQVAEDEGVTRQRISQIELKALGKLRLHKRSKLVEGFI